MVHVKRFLALPLIVALAACGGGGTGGPASTSGQAQTGQMIRFELKNGPGVVSGTLQTGDFPVGTVLPYTFTATDPQSSVLVKLDGVQVPAAGQVTMNQYHVIETLLDNQPGAHAPEFSGVAADGSTVKLSDFHGGWVFVDFSEVYCPGSVNEASYLQAHRSAWQARGMSIVTVLVWSTAGTYASASDLTAWQNTYGLTFPVLMDPNHAADIYCHGIASNTTDFPSGYIIDPSGVIRAKFRGFDGPTIDAAVATLFP
jgi:peroxiredoxin